MWRAFFFAVGAMLIILGAQCLITDQFVLTSQTRIPAVVKRILSDDQRQPNPLEIQPIASSASRTAGSAFGAPSRLGGSTFSNANFGSSNYYGGGPNGNSGNQGNGQFLLAGFGRTPDQLPPQPISIGANGNAGRVSQVVPTKDWMPWSLLAAGTIIMLYTHSSTGRGFSSE